MKKLLVRIALLAATAVSLHAHAAQPGVISVPYKSDPNTPGVDCVVMADSTCIKKGAVRTMQGGTDGTSQRVPDAMSLLGYTERTVTYNPGEVSAEDYAFAVESGGWPTKRCTQYVGDPYSTPSSCSDGRNVESLLNACNGVHAKVMYAMDVVTSSSCQHTEGATYTCNKSTERKYFTCSPPGTTLSLLVKDPTKAATTTIKALTSAQVAAFNSGTDGVVANQATMNKVCQAYGFAGTYDFQPTVFSSCSNNRLANWTGTQWQTVGACGNQFVRTLTCAN